MSSTPGWLGTREELFSALERFEVERNVDGEFLLFGDLLLFGESFDSVPTGELIVTHGTWCRVDGKLVNLQELLSRSAQGESVQVFDVGAPE